MLWQASLSRLLASEILVINFTSSLSDSEVADINRCRCAVIAGYLDSERPLSLTPEFLQRLSIPVAPYIGIVRSGPATQLPPGIVQTIHALHSACAMIAAVDRTTASEIQRLGLDKVRAVGPPSQFWTRGATLPAPSARSRETTIIVSPPSDLSLGNEAKNETLIQTVNAATALAGTSHVLYAAYDADDRMFWGRRSVPEQAIVQPSTPHEYLELLIESGSLLISLDPEVAALAAANGVATVNVVTTSSASELLALDSVDSTSEDNDSIAHVARRLRQVMDGDFEGCQPDQHRFHELRVQMDEFLKDHNLPIAVDRASELRLSEQLISERRSRDIEVRQLRMAAMASVSERNLWRDNCRQLQAQLDAIPWRAVGLYRAASRLIPRKLLHWLAPMVDRFRRTTPKDRR